MSKFNTGAVRTAPRSRTGSTPLGAVSSVPDTRTYEGGLAFTQGPASELFHLLSGSFVAEKSFYEAADAKLDRVRSLVERISAEDTSENKAVSGEWFRDFINWLRREGNMRTAPGVLAAEAVYARLRTGGFSFNRDMIDRACDRADEPGEVLAYWRSRFGKVPSAVQRGLADAVVRLYDEFSTLKYDTASHTIRFGDVVEMAEPRTNSRVAPDRQNNALLRHLIDRRHDYNTSAVPEQLSMLRAREELDAIPVGKRRAVLDAPERIYAAGMTWEVLASWLNGPMDDKAWSVMIPRLGYMALIRNLRNFDEAGISQEVSRKIAARLADPEQVAKSRQFPYRFWNAYREVQSDNWGAALNDALELSIQNIPALPGRTLILVDTSASMQDPVSEKSSAQCVDVAALFGIALAMRCGPENVDLVGFASGSFVHPLAKGGSVLRQMAKFHARIGEVGHGTDIAGAVSSNYRGHDRVVQITDEQGSAGNYYNSPSDRVPAHVPYHSYKLNGYRAVSLPDQPNRFSSGGIADSTFRMISQAEAGSAASWPWLTTSS